ncbi:DUF4123 domain-containing protein [Paraburkholderia lacunae]|uniref:DUF4123 domain-containing protein n=1 Tax=Paraburkholderia lacunae TaxID=2211104 RepID=A0A370NB57_9BURK|nr:DUF4123 domain-containing protein [Paraburkholderia lacunae]RDK02837.1 DUF4123 domain-containing protein [Paraburkholderia lacunae]
MDTQLAFAEVEPLGAHLYALVDPVQNAALPGALSARPDHIVCLMDGGSDVQAVSPHLVYIPPGNFDSVRVWLDQHAPAAPCASLLASPLPLVALAGHLKQFLRVHLPDGELIVLAFWDPAILATLIGSRDDETLFVKGPVLTDAQRQAFLAPVLRWSYWDRGGVLRQVDWTQERMPASAAPLRPPLKLEQVQVDALIDASVPDGLLQHIGEHAPDALADVPEHERYGFVCRQIERARQLGIEGTGAWMDYCTHVLMRGDFFDSH